MTNTPSPPIDFVIPWVDGNDPAWNEERKKFEQTSDRTGTSVEANAECRYRVDEGWLRYWFRAVEQLTPWVRKIHFITCGQKPDWLDGAHPKLNLVHHQDYIPAEYLPTFNSNTIELNLHRLDALAEHFVLYNDDVFPLQPTDPSFFFRDGVPVLLTDLRYTARVGYNNWSRILFNDYCVLNNRFDARRHIWANRGKWFNIKALGIKRVRQNLLCFLANKAMPVDIYGHMALPHLKSTLAALWEAEGEVMDRTCRHRFRNDEQVNQYLLCAWDQAVGRFFPVRGDRLGKMVTLRLEYQDTIREDLLNRKYPQVCLNDNPDNVDPEVSGEMVRKAFETLFPAKSSFELY